ncbi:MAG: hypothetical protein PHD82_01555 [Candidatus Riflebacteria bacterium]|nr:hypothetical protein [Candidatus Riflebacteria bacterium]
MLLLLLVMLVAGGIAALKLMPEQELITIRSKENSLNLELSQIREAFDLMQIASPSWQPWADDFDPAHPDAAASIALTLKTLHENGFLRDPNIYDPGIMKQLWGTSTNKIFWKASGNVASNSSFQIDMLSWNWNQTDTDAATDTIFPESSNIDDYPYQNKLGNLLDSTGASLKIIR